MHIRHGMRLQIESGSLSQTKWVACNCLDSAAIVVVWCWCEDHLLLAGLGGASNNASLEPVLKKLANVLRPLLVCDWSPAGRQ